MPYSKSYTFATLSDVLYTFYYLDKAIVDSKRLYNISKIKRQRHLLPAEKKHISVQNLSMSTLSKSRNCLAVENSTKINKKGKTAIKHMDYSLTCP